CTGCCDAHGQCQNGNQPSACGENGLACTVCGALDSCTLGTCVPFAPGTGGGSSGSGGGASGGGHAGGGFAGMGGGDAGGGFVGSGGGSGGVGGGSGGTGGGSTQCGPDNCPFCCDAFNRCLPTSDQACGVSGEACFDCTLNRGTCNAFVCTGGTGGG